MSRAAHNSPDCYEARVRFYFNAPRRTHKVMCEGVHIGDVWDDGQITMLDEVPMAAPPVRADHDG
jgi:hypothetical protein